MGSTELLANLFRIPQTEEKLRKDKVEGAEAATKVHYSFEKEVKSAIEKIGVLCQKICLFRRKAFNR